MLEESLKTGLREGFIKKSELTRVNVDSTVQEKAVRYPTDARLYDRLRERLVKSARKNGIELRQTYERIGKKVLRSQSGYAKAKYAPSEGHLDLRQTAWYVLPQTGIMGGRHGT